MSEKKKEEEKAEAWLAGQKKAKKEFIPSAHKEYLRKERQKEMERELDDLEAGFRVEQHGNKNSEEKEEES